LKEDHSNQVGIGKKEKGDKEFQIKFPKSPKIQGGREFEYYDGGTKNL